MRTILTISLLSALLLPTNAQKSSVTSKAPSQVPGEDIESAVRKGFGPKVTIESRLSSEPFYLLGDFNGDGFSDLAVLVNIEEARADLKNHGVKYININPYSRLNGSQIDPLNDDSHNCLGIAIIHGRAEGWNTANPIEKFMIYECFSSFRLIRKGQRIRRGSGSRGLTPVPKGDSIFLDLETGGTALIYWNGRTYRGFGIRGGD